MSDFDRVGLQLAGLDGPEVYCRNPRNLNPVGGICGADTAPEIDVSILRGAWAFLHPPHVPWYGVLKQGVLESKHGHFTQLQPHSCAYLSFFVSRL
jgi:hypothetical protein